MGGTLNFKIEEVKKVVEASSNKVMLVGDHGVYLCSDKFEEGANRATVAYAEGINPEVDEFESWWDKKGQIYGGDDGVDDLSLKDLKEMLEVAAKNNIKTLKIKLTTKSMKFFIEADK